MRLRRQDALGKIGSLAGLGRIGLAPPAHPAGGGYDPVKALGTDLLGYWDVRRASTVTLASGKVASLKDVMSSYDMAQANAGAQPLLAVGGFDGLDCMVLDGADDCLLLPSVPFPAGADECELWAVVQQDAPASEASNRTILAYGNSSATSRRFSRSVLSGANRLQSLVGTGASSVTNYETSKFLNDAHVVRSIVKATDLTSGVDGALSVATAAVPATAVTRTRIGASAAATPTEFWQGKIVCILITKRLSAGASAALQTYLEGVRGLPYERHYSRTKAYAFSSDRSVQRFEVRSGDTVFAADITNGNERSELSMSAANQPIHVDGRKVRISYGLMVESGDAITNAFNILGQVHSTEDPSEAHQRPTVAFVIGPSGKLQLNIVADPNPISDGTAPVVVVWTSPNVIPRDQWQQIELELLQNPTAGHIKLTFNNAVVFDAPIAVGYNDQQPGYFKHGIYRKAAAETLAVRYTPPRVVTIA